MCISRGLFLSFSGLLFLIFMERKVGCSQNSRLHHPSAANHKSITIFFCNIANATAKSHPAPTGQESVICAWHGILFVNNSVRRLSEFECVLVRYNSLVTYQCRHRRPGSRVFVVGETP